MNINYNASNFGKGIRALREEQGLTQSELVTILKAHGISICIQTLSNYENGKTHARSPKIIQIAKAMGVKTIDIFKAGIEQADNKEENR